MQKIDYNMNNKYDIIHRNCVIYITLNKALSYAILSYIKLDYEWHDKRPLKGFL